MYQIDTKAVIQKNLEKPYILADCRKLEGIYNDLVRQGLEHGAALNAIYRLGWENCRVFALHQRQKSIMKKNRQPIS